MEDFTVYPGRELMRGRMRKMLKRGVLIIILVLGAFAVIVSLLGVVRWFYQALVSTQFAVQTFAWLESPAEKLKVIELILIIWVISIVTQRRS